MTDQQTLRDYALKKDAQAFRDLVEQYQRLVYSAASRRLADSHDVEDVVQTTFLKLAKAAGAIHRDVASWLYSTAVNAANDLIRRDQTRRRHEALAAEPESVVDDLEKAEWNKLSLIIDDVLLQMPESQRSLIIEHFLRGRSQRDLAEELGTSQPTVLRRINAAVDELRACLADLGYTTVVPSLASVLEKIPQPNVPAALTTQLAKIGLSGIRPMPSSFAGFGWTNLGAGALIFASVAACAFIYFTAPLPKGGPVPSGRFVANTTQGLQGRVLSPDGSAVSGATVFIAFPGRSETRIRNGNADEIDAGSPHTVTSADGGYNLQQPTGTFLLVAIANAGYAEIDQATIAKDSTVRLSAWGRIQGRMMTETKPEVGAQLQAGRIQRGPPEEPIVVSIVSRAKTDGIGNFSMDRLIQGENEIDQNMEQHSGSNSMVFGRNLGIADIVGGQTTELTLGGVGRPIVGKFIFPEGKNPHDFFLNARAHLVGSSSRNVTTPQSSQVDSYLLDVDADRHFRIDNVTPGNYRIHVFLQSVHGDRTLQPDQMQFTMPDIPGGVSDEPMTIPDIQLR